MHPDIKLEIDENVSERTVIFALYHAGLDVIVTDGGTIRVKLREATESEAEWQREIQRQMMDSAKTLKAKLRASNVADFCERRLLKEAGKV